MPQSIDDFTIVLPELTEMAAGELKVYYGLDRLWRMVERWCTVQINRIGSPGSPIFCALVASSQFSLRHAQASASETLVRHTATIPCALHSDLCLLAQSGGDLVQPHYAISHSPGNVQQRERLDRENRSLRPEFQPPSAAFCLDRHSGFDLR